MRRPFTLLFFPMLLLLFSGSLFAQDKGDKGNEKKGKSDSKIKPYEEIITESAVSDSGLFNVHKVGAKYYFELPNDLLGKEILVVSRIAGFVKNLNFGGAGMKSRPQQVIRWQRKDEKVLLRSVSFNKILRIRKFSGVTSTYSSD